MLPAPFIPSFHVSPPLCVTFMQLRGHATSLALPADLWSLQADRPRMICVHHCIMKSILCPEDDVPPVSLSQALQPLIICLFWNIEELGSHIPWLLSLDNIHWFALSAQMVGHCLLSPVASWGASPECHCCVTWPFYKVCNSVLLWMTHLILAGLFVGWDGEDQSHRWSCSWQCCRQFPVYTR